MFGKFEHVIPYVGYEIDFWNLNTIKISIFFLFENFSSTEAEEVLKSFFADSNHIINHVTGEHVYCIINLATQYDGLKFYGKPCPKLHSMDYGQNLINKFLLEALKKWLK